VKFFKHGKWIEVAVDTVHMHLCVHAYVCVCNCMCVCVYAFKHGEWIEVAVDTVHMHLCVYACVCVYAFKHGEWIEVAVDTVHTMNCVRACERSKMTLCACTEAAMRGQQQAYFHANKTYVCVVHLHHGWLILNIQTCIPAKSLFVHAQRLPCEDNNRPIFARSTDKSEFWVSILEKAYAKVCAFVWEFNTCCVHDRCSLLLNSDYIHSILGKAYAKVCVCV
jgi:hypothetical protein